VTAIGLGHSSLKVEVGPFTNCGPSSGLVAEIRKPTVLSLSWPIKFRLPIRAGIDLPPGSTTLRPPSVDQLDNRRHSRDGNRDGSRLHSDTASGNPIGCHAVESRRGRCSGKRTDGQSARHEGPAYSRFSNFKGLSLPNLLIDNAPATGTVAGAGVVEPAAISIPKTAAITPICLNIFISITSLLPRSRSNQFMSRSLFRPCSSTYC
jgi:hypothetical protein